mgnify:CR=1 FL=1
MCYVLYKSWAFCALNTTFPFPHVFPQPPFPLKREPTASAPRGDTLGSRIDRDISLIMPPSFVRRLRNNMAQSDGTTVKLGARYGRRLATPIPSSNRHMPCIRTLRINQNLRNCTECNITHALHAYHCPQDNITVPLGTISLACRCGSITKSPFASGRIAKGLFVIVRLIRVALVDFVDYSKDNIQSQSHRVGGKTLGNVVVRVIVMTHDGVLSGECD